MSSTFDYRRGRVSIARASGWSREFQSIAAGRTGITCGILRDRSAQGDVISLRGRIGNGGELSLVGPNLLFGNVAHAETCLDCAALAPLARLLHELQQQRKCGEQNETLTGIPMEVYLEWRSCGCRNHPEIVNVSKEWPLGGARPAERCGRQSAQFRLEDPSDIRMLSEAIAQSAAVLDREEIYTCFMRPLLEPVKERALALR
jgi:hypothetical protein